MENDVCSSRSSCEALSNRSSPSKSEHFDSTILPSEQLLLLNHTAGIVIEDLVFSLFDCLGSKTRKKRNFKSDKSSCPLRFAVVRILLGDSLMDPPPMIIFSAILLFCAIMYRTMDKCKINLD